MGTLRRRNNKWHVQIRRKHYPSQTRTFNNKLAALRWIRNTEVKLEQNDVGLLRKDYPKLKSLKTVFSAGTSVKLSTVRNNGGNSIDIESASGGATNSPPCQYAPKF